MRFPSARSAGFAVLMALVAAVLIVCVFIAPAAFRPYGIMGAALAIALLLWIWFGTWYEFREEHLTLRFGPFFERIPYARITGARDFKGMISSMALSSDMIELTHGKNYITGTTYISPADKDGFLLELRSRCINLI